MQLFAPSRLLTLILTGFAFLPAFAQPADPVVTPSPRPASTIVIGFVGGFVRHDNPHQGPVKLARRLLQAEANKAHVEVFENRHRRKAYRTILKLLDADHDGALSKDEKSSARIVLFGHSWGASAVVLLARDLQKQGIPVLLTVQVDSVAKLWQKDEVIPANVQEAVNFHQPHGFVHGRSQITAADPARTKIIGNYLFDYEKNPVQCSELSWIDRLIMENHAKSECDPRLWSQVEDLVKQRLSPQVSSAEVPATSGTSAQAANYQ